MKTLQTLLLVALAISLAQPVLDKRSVIQLRNMILCMMPKSWPTLAYTDYGCYCGIGGSGTPVDDTDRCCQVHDKCWGDAIAHPKCWKFFDSPYFEHYSYNCDQSRGKITCGNDNNECEMFICECDRVAVECFTRSPWTFKHYNVPKHKCQ
ncbi:phospholipase A2-like [Halichoeres trimaculatus]|uniref:phospholipase A2-like n=1 Tax=Halichoeres trimaculatus TaxID=147232 RepID=UPI003D9E3904